MKRFAAALALFLLSVASFAAERTNATYSPDSTKIAFTRANDLYVADASTGEETRLTFDGSDLILNGFASWVYYEEILGRPSRYRAFWWSPDSKTLAFYHFDNSTVPMFPIYSPFGQDGKLNLTRYPKAGKTNPQVRIGFVSAFGSGIVWADFDETEDQYFGIPFWGADSKKFFVAHEPRIQNTLDLYSVDPRDGSKVAIYHETYKTWLDWPEGMLFNDKGLFMVRSFETGYDQIYFLSFDGKVLKRLTSGPNRQLALVREDNGTVYFTAQRDAVAKQALYSVDSKGNITPLTDPALNATDVEFTPDGKFFTVTLSSLCSPKAVWRYETAYANLAWRTRNAVASGRKTGKRPGNRYADKCERLSVESTEPVKNPSFVIQIKASDGQLMPAVVTLPVGFDSTKTYPVHMQIYGGPGTQYVRDRWTGGRKSWFAQNGIIDVTADCRASGHTGRAGTDLVYKDLTTVPVEDFLTWAEYFRSLPYVDGSRIGVEGFSFGGTMTAMLLLRHPDVFCCGIAGGGVYDWALYDTHYAERFMETPQTNPDGYERAKTLNYVAGFDDTKGTLRLTHGTGDDNVHFQNTLQLIDALQRAGKHFEFMIYPDAMHGYRGEQHKHDEMEAHRFWSAHLLK